uniref:Uncharacterized protein n=1 Tax=Arundo donax TaxID=35708 RepID=A0A0A9EP51_ARUDO
MLICWVWIQWFGQLKVRHLGVPVVVQQYVARLKISMYYPLAKYHMKIIDSLRNGVYNV